MFGHNFQNSLTKEKTEEEAIAEHGGPLHLDPPDAGAVACPNKKIINSLIHDYNLEYMK